MLASVLPPIAGLGEGVDVVSVGAGVGVASVGDGAGAASGDDQARRLEGALGVREDLLLTEVDRVPHLGLEDGVDGLGRDAARAAQHDPVTDGGLERVDDDLLGRSSGGGEQDGCCRGARGKALPHRFSSDRRRSSRCRWASPQPDVRPLRKTADPRSRGRRRSCGDEPDLPR